MWKKQDKQVQALPQQHIVLILLQALLQKRVGKPVVVNPTETIVKVAAKDKVVETPIEPEVEYVRDGEREVDTPNERVEGAKGKTVTTTTYDVDPKDGHITEHVGNPVVSPAGKTIVKVGAKLRLNNLKILKVVM